MASQPPDQTGTNFTVDSALSTTVPSRASVSPDSTDLNTVLQLINQAVASVRSEMMGEVKALAASVRESETKRSADVDKITHTLAGVPKLADIQKANRNAILALSAIVIAALVGFWTVFGVGASITGGIADRVVESRQEQANQAQAVRQIANTQQQILTQLKKNEQQQNH